MRNSLPETGYMRQSQILGQKAITEEQARKNRDRKKGPRRSREEIPAMVPVGASSWWSGVRSGKYPAPLKLGPRTTVWRVEDIRALIERIKSGEMA